MTENQRLLQLARLRVREGELPLQTSTTALGGRSAGARCGLCTQPVEAGGAEIELVWTEPGGRKSALLHPACHGAWLAASTRSSQVESI
jgi:hypothetical protein